MDKCVAKYCLLASKAHYFAIHEQELCNADLPLFVSFFKWLLCVETHLGPDGTNLKQNLKTKL